MGSSMMFQCGSCQDVGCRGTLFAHIQPGKLSPVVVELKRAQDQAPANTRMAFNLPKVRPRRCAELIHKPSVMLTQDQTSKHHNGILRNNAQFFMMEVQPTQRRSFYNVRCICGAICASAPKACSTAMLNAMRIKSSLNLSKTS